MTSPSSLHKKPVHLQTDLSVFNRFNPPSPSETSFCSNILARRQSRLVHAVGAAVVKGMATPRMTHTMINSKTKTEKQQFRNLPQMLESSSSSLSFSTVSDSIYILCDSFTQQRIDELGAKKKTCLSLDYLLKRHVFLSVIYFKKKHVFLNI
jgi:hypothetical protein